MTESDTQYSINVSVRSVWALWIVDFAGWPVSPRARAALSARTRAGGVRGLWMLTIWPLGGWFPHWLPLFPANNWDLIWEEISKAPVTPLGQVFEGDISLSHGALWRPWAGSGHLWHCGILTFYTSNRKIKLPLGILWGIWRQKCVSKSSDLQYFSIHRRCDENLANSKHISLLVETFCSNSNELKWELRKYVKDWDFITTYIVIIREHTSSVIFVRHYMVT